MEKQIIWRGILSGAIAGVLAFVFAKIFLEPVIGRLRRRADTAFDLPDGHKIEAGQNFVIDIRSVNSDSSAVGACPYHLDPERQMPDPRTGAAAMGFGDGRHRCPGAFIALEESEVFLVQLLALPGLRLVGQLPDSRGGGGDLLEQPAQRLGSHARESIDRTRGDRAVCR